MIVRYVPDKKGPFQGKEEIEIWINPEFIHVVHATRTDDERVKATVLMSDGNQLNVANDFNDMVDMLDDYRETRVQIESD